MKKATLAEKILDVLEDNFASPQCIRDLARAEWHLFLHDVKFDSEHINLTDVLKDGGEKTVLLKVTEPVATPCPPPPDPLMGWISTPNWDKYRLPQVEIREEISRPVEGKGHVPEKFDEDPARPDALAAWQSEREAWRESELLKERTRNLFADLYKVLVKIQKNPDRFDLWLGDVFFTDAADADLNYPLLLKKITLRLNDGAMEIISCGEPTVFYGEILEGLPDVHAVAAQKMTEKYAQHFSPLAPNLGKLMPRLATVISSACRFSNEPGAFLPDDRYVIYQKPVFLLSPRSFTMAPWLSDLRLIGERDDDFAALTCFDQSDQMEIIDYEDASKAADDLADGKIKGLTVFTPPGTKSAAYAAKIMLKAVASGKRALVVGASSLFLERVWQELPEKIRAAIAAPDCLSVEETFAAMKELLAKSPKEISENIAALNERKKNALEAEEAAQKKLDELIKEELKADAYEYSQRMWSRRQMAEFMAENAEVSDMIPGHVQEKAAFPLDEDEVSFLYRAAGEFDARTRADMEQELPSMSDLPSAYSYEGFLRELKTLEARQNELIKELPGWRVDENDQLVSPQNETLSRFDQEAFKEAQLAYQELAFSWLEFPWAKEAILAGRQGGGKRRVWDQLGEDISKVQKLKDAAVTLLLGKVIECPAEVFNDEDALKDLAAIEKSMPATGRGKLSLFARLFNRRRKWLCDQILINGKEIACQEDCQTAARYIELQQARAKVQAEWDQLMGPCGGPTYAELSESGDDVDDLCSARWQQILYCLDWYEKKYKIFCGQLIDLGLDTDRLLPEGKFLTPHQKLAEDITWLKMNWPRFEAVLRLLYIDKRLLKNHEETYLSAVIDDDSRLGKRIRQALENRDASAYRIAMSMLKRYKTLSLDYARLEKILTSIKKVAPEWADYFLDVPPETEAPTFESLTHAWQYAQFRQVLADQQQAVFRAEEVLRDAASEVKKVEGELTEALISQQFMLKMAEQDLIDTALGEEMPQNFVAMPLAWLLTPRRAAELHFEETADITIIGEAQAIGLRALPFALLTKTLVLLGDDRGLTDPREVIVLPQMPPMPSIYHLYRPRLAHTHLSLHFASVPQIVGYFNHLIYEQRLIPARPEGNLPALIAYEIDGEQDAQTGLNKAEAETVTAILAAALEDPRYEGKTFGVITKTEAAQAELIGELALRHIGTTELAQRKFIWGTADELKGRNRDIVFLSLTESDAGTAVSTSSEGTEGEPRPTETTGSSNALFGSMAATAREQLWVIHSKPKNSFDAEACRLLIDYAAHSENYLPDAAKLQEEDDDSRQKNEIMIEELAELLGDEEWFVRANWPTGHRLADLAVFTADKIALVDFVGEGRENQGSLRDQIASVKINLLPGEFIKEPAKIVAELAAELVGSDFAAAGDPAVSGGKSMLRVMVKAQTFLQEWQDAKSLTSASSTEIAEEAEVLPKGSEGNESQI